MSFENILEKSAFVIYMTVLVIGPVFFGAVHTYAYTLMFSGVLVATLLVLVSKIQKNPVSGNLCFQFPLVGALPGICLGIAFCMFQLTPLPMGILEWISPKAAFFHRMAFPEAADGNSWASLGVYAYPIRQSLVRFFVYGLLFIGMIQVLNSRKRIETATAVLLVMMAMESVYGIYQTYGGEHRILWFKDAVSAVVVTGTYINRNHFAGLMEIGIILATCFSAAVLVQKQDSGTDLPFHRRLMNWMLPYLSGIHGGEKRILILFMGVVIGIGLILSASRGGMIAAAGGLLAVCILYLFQRDHRRKGYVLLVLVAIIAVYASHIGVNYVLDRFRGMEGDYAVRYRYMQSTLSLFDDFPVAGTGIGNFSNAFPRYQAAEDSGYFIDYAHNDWVQFLSEAGMAGMVTLIAGLVCFLVDLGSKWKKRSHAWSVSMGAVPFGVLVAIAIHSYSDFNLHIPANFLVLSATLALGYCAACMEPGSAGHAPGYRVIRYPLIGKGGVLLAVLIALVAYSATWTLRHAIAEGWCPTEENSTLNQEADPSIEKIRKAIAWDSWNAQYWFKLGMETDRREVGQDAVIGAFEKAVRLNPYNSDYHLKLGWAYLKRASDPAEAGKWLALSDERMNRAAYGAGVDAQILESLGNYWIMRSKSLTTPQSESIDLKNNAFFFYDRAIELLNDKDKLQARERISRFAEKNE